MLRIYVEIEKENLEKKQGLGYQYGDIRLDMDENAGKPYGSLVNAVPLAKMPEELKDIVIEVTLRETIIFALKRQGFYKHKTAVGTVLSYFAHGREEQTLEIKSKNLEDLQELYLLIMGNKIKPSSSFETPKWRSFLRLILRRR